LIAGREIPSHHPELFVGKTITLEDSSYPAVFTKTDGLLDSPSFVLELCKKARTDTVEFLFNTSVESVNNSSGNWEIKTNNSEISANTLVKAACAWITQPIEKLPHLLFTPQPFPRHLFLVTNWPEDFMPHLECGYFWDEINHWYLRRWDKTTRLVSICDQTPAQPSSYVAPSSMGTQLSEKLLESLPESIASKLRIGRSWHCFRTYTEDFLPIWGWDNQSANMFWLAAFGGFGMSTGFAATKDAADEILGRKTNISSDILVQRRNIRQKIALQAV